MTRMLGPSPVPPISASLSLVRSFLTYVGVPHAHLTGDESWDADRAGASRPR